MRQGCQERPLACPFPWSFFVVVVVVLCTILFHLVMSLSCYNLINNYCHLDLYWAMIMRHTRLSRKTSGFSLASSKFMHDCTMMQWFLDYNNYDQYHHKNVDNNIIIVVNIHGSLNSAKCTLLITLMYVDLLLHIGLSG